MSPGQNLIENRCEMNVARDDILLCVYSVVFVVLLYFLYVMSFVFESSLTYPIALVVFDLRLREPYSNKPIANENLY
jgi:hypothetical protein